MSNAIGLIELSSIAIAYAVQDAMLKAADVRLLLARTICSGKFLIVVGGEVAGVTSSVAAGVEVAPDSIIDDLVIPNIHASVFEAISGSATLEPAEIDALGVVETFTVASIIEAGDAAAKAANVKLYRIHVAMAIGGKGFLLVTGDVSSVRAAVDAAVQVAMQHGVLVAQSVIPRPNRELFSEYV
ncbi:MAG: BMC domain-containing protein [bacterium]|jgi:microcompartment protein CcmL/EutN